MKSSEPRPSVKRRRKSQLDQLEQDQTASSSGIPFTRDKDGGITVDLDKMLGNNDEGTPVDYESSEFYDNLVDKLDDKEKARLGALVRANHDLHKNARSEWETMITQGTQLLGIKMEEKNTPFRGACSAQHPLLMESSVKFQSKASNELLPANGPVKAKIMGEVTAEREAQGNRVAAHMNYQLTEEMTEFYSDTERLLLYLPLFGSAFKKIYYSSYLGRPVSEFVPADQLIVPSNSPDLNRADCFTQILYKTQNQLDEDFNSGFYEKPAMGIVKPSALEPTLIQTALNTAQGVDVSFSTGNYNTTYTLYEQYIDTCVYKADGESCIDPYDGETEHMASPYIITINSTTSEVLGLRRNWDEGDKKRCKKVPFVQYQFVPGFGFYGLGFLHLLGNLQLTLTASMRSLVDAGQFATLQGGFKLKGVRIVDDGEPIHPGQFKEIDSSIMDINKSIMQLPFKEPSQTLFAMLQYLTDAGQKFADATEQVVGDSSNYGPVGTTLALLDASTKFFSAIHKRLHNSQKQELRIIAQINSETLADDLEYNQQAGIMAVTRQDYDDNVDIVPVSDPNISSNAHRMAKAQTIMQVAMQTPEFHDMREVLKLFYEAVDFGNIDKILPQPQQAQPQDPLTDIQSAVQGKPIQAFPGQAHQSYIGIMQAFLQDPQSGGNPMMQKGAQAILACIQQHMMLQFSEQVQATMQNAQAQQQGQQGMQATQGGQVPSPNMQGGQPAPPTQPDGQMVAPQTAAPTPDPMVQAAQHVAQINQQLMQQQAQQGQQNAKDQAALMLAQAEMMDSQTGQRKQQFDESYKTAQLSLNSKQLDIKKAELATKAHLATQKIQGETDKAVKLKGIEAMTDGLKQGHEAKMLNKNNEAKLEQIKAKPKPNGGK